MAQSNPISLLGPPEIYHPTTAAAAKSDPLMDLMVAKFNNKSIQQNPPMGYTENYSPTFLSTGNPCLDFFFHVVPDTPPQTLTQRLELAWKHDPLTALKLVCNLRGVRGTGKSDKEGAYTAMLWLHNHHPKTLACNVASFADFGYFKDLLEILFRVLDGPDARELAKAMYERWKEFKEAKAKHKQAQAAFMRLRRTRPQRGRGFGGPRRGYYGRGRAMAHRGRGRFVARPVYGMTAAHRGGYGRGRGRTMAHRGYGRGRSMAHRGYGGSALVQRGGYGRNRISRGTFDKFKTNGPELSREEKRIERAKRVVERFNRDPDFKFLHDRVSDHFAGCLRSDMEMLNSGRLNKISLAAKWFPSLDSSYDRITLLCEPIARKVFPREEYPEYEGVEEAHYAYRVRDRLRKQVLVPLRKALELPEVYIGANDWGSLKYNRVASVAMKTYKGKFLKHDEERFEEYLEKVKTGKAKIAVGALLPHQIIASLEDDDGGQVAELQWKRMVDDMSKVGKLNNCLAICDVSGSMEGVPMEVCVALGILVSELSDKPWKGKLITFSAKPKLQNAQGNSLMKKTEFVRRMEWGMNTNFQKVFDLLLQVAVNGKLRPDQMIKRLFVFSDMEFDVASANPWETDYQAIVRKFKEKGYGECVPEIVFWNLRDSKATPVPSNQQGVALVSGFSKNLMKIFLEEGGILNPESVMEAAISGKEYQKLVVLD